MTRNVELGYSNPPILEIRQLGGSEGGVVVQTSLEVFVPLTSDVVRDENSGYPSLQ